MGTVQHGGSPSIEVLTLALAGEAFALEAAIVSEILDVVPITEVPNAPQHVRGLINVRGKVVPLVDMRARFGMAPAQHTIDTRIVVIELTLDEEPSIVGLVADKVYEVARIAADSIEATPRVGLRWRADFIRGISRRGSDFLIILDLIRILASDQQPFISETTHDSDHARPIRAGK